MKIKFFSAMLAAMLTFSLVSCNVGENKGNKKGWGKDAEKQVAGTDGLEYYPLADGTYGVAAGKAKNTAVVEISPSYDGYVVTRVLELGFKDASGVKKVIIPNSVTMIDKAAFEGCGSLEEIVVPKSVVAIGENAFVGCESLKTLKYEGTLMEAAELFSGKLCGIEVDIICADGTLHAEPGFCGEYMSEGESGE